MDSNDGPGLSPSTLTFLAGDPLATSSFDAATSSIHSALLTDPLRNPHSSYDQHHQQHHHAMDGRRDSGNQLLSTSTAPTGGASRKQNVACDACRQKKIRCQRTTTAETCEQCLTKGSECTSNYIEQLQNKAKKARKSRGEGTNGETLDSVSRKRSRTDLDEVDPALRRQSSGGSGGPSVTPTASARRRTLTPRAESSQNKYLHTPSRPATDLRPSEKQANLVRYLLSPVPVIHSHWGYSDLSSMEQCEAGNSDIWEEDGGRVWKEESSEGHLALTDVGIRELADDLVESFFSLAHPRFAMYDPIHVRARLAAPDTHPDGPVPHNLLAVAIAFGSRFSDHPVINADRDECSRRDDAEYGVRSKPPRSRLIQMLVIRAREVLEVQKTHRIQCLNNAQVLIIAESLLGQVPFSKDKYYPYFFAGAVRQVCQLGYNHPKGLLAIQNEKEKSSAVFAWWLVCISDGFRAVFHRLKPSLSDASYDITPPEAPEVEHPKQAGPSEDRGDQAVVWFGAAAAGSKMCRQLCSDLWTLRVQNEGIPVAALQDFVTACSSWRDNYLSRLGVPNKWPTTWNFEAAITACSTDAYYHTLWLVVEHAINDFGIAELQAQERGEKVVIGPEVEVVRKRIREEAEHGALRITALTSVLVLNHYLRLDPLILHHPMYEAGLYLAEQGREESLACVAGLRQYCIAYPQFWTQAEEIERLYNARLLSGRPSPASGLTSSRPGTSTATSISGILSTPMTSISSPFAVSPKDNRANELANNGYSSLVDRRGEAPGQEERDISFALFEWLHQP